MKTRIRPTKKEIAATFNFYEVISGNIKNEQLTLFEPDYRGYRHDKRIMENTPFKPEQYEKVVKVAVKRRVGD